MNLCGNLSSFIDARADEQFTADDLAGALSMLTSPSPLDGWDESESDTCVSDIESDHLVENRDDDRDTRGLAVARHIGQCLLRHTEEADRKFGRQGVRPSIALQVDFDRKLRRHLAAKVLQCRFETEMLQLGRMELVRELRRMSGREFLHAAAATWRPAGSPCIAVRRSTTASASRALWPASRCAVRCRRCNSRLIRRRSSSWARIRLRRQLLKLALRLGQALFRRFPLRDVLDHRNDERWLPVIPVSQGDMKTRPQISAPSFG